MSKPKFAPLAVGTRVQVAFLPPDTASVVVKVYDDYPTTYRYLLANMLVVDHGEVWEVE